MGRISGVYTCKARARTYRYDIVCGPPSGGVIWWSGTVDYDGGAASTAGTIDVEVGADPDAFVRRAVEDWIEAASCYALAYGHIPPST